MSNILCLPPEVILHIFRFYLETETQYDFIHSVSMVCRDWQKLCFDPTCWQKFDGTLSFNELKELSCKGILKYCSKLVFSKIKDFPTAKDLEEVYCGLPQLKSINFTNVTDMRNKNYFDELACKCPALQEIVYNDKALDNTSPSIVKWPLYGCRLFKNFLKIRGTDLVSLIFSNLSISSFESSTFFFTIGKSCPNLELLKVENMDCETIYFPTVHLQEHCPKLKVLCLGDPVSITNQGHIVGFEYLEIFKNPSRFNFLLPNCAINSVIFASPKLKELDISGCLFAQRNCLHPHNDAHLENLNISSGIVYDLECFTEVVQKWSCSLKVLNLSKIDDVSINELFMTVITHGSFPNLIFLNLNETLVTILTVKLIIQNCPQLCVLSLENCSYLGDFSSNYEGVAAIKKLFTKI